MKILVLFTFLLLISCNSRPISSLKQPICNVYKFNTIDMKIDRNTLNKMCLEIFKEKNETFNNINECIAKFGFFNITCERWAE